MEWIETNLKHYVDVESGAAFKSDEFVENGIPVVKIANISGYTTVPTKGDSYIKETEAEKYKSVQLQEGDVLIAMSGNTTCKMGRVSEQYSPSLLNQRVGWIKPISDEINIDYVFHLLISQKYQNRLWTYATATGQPNLSPRDIKRIAFSKPPKPEQIAIANILSKIDKTIEATKNSIKSAEKLKKALMQNLLTGKLKPDGTWRTANEFYKDEKFGKVPVGWKIKSIKQLFDFFPTSSYSRSKLIDKGEIGYIHYGDIHTKFDRLLDLSSESVPFIPNELEKKYEKLKDGDLVVSDASEDWDGVGKSIEIFNSNSKKVIAGLHTLHLRPKSDDLILGIKGYIMDLYQVSTSIKRMATGAKVYGVSKSSLYKILLPIPSEPEQQAIKMKLDEVSNEISQKQDKIKTLQRLKKSLMQNLLTGKVRLPEEFIAQFENELEETNTKQVAQ